MNLERHGHTDLCRACKPAEQCAASGCAKPRRYACSASGLPLCSLQCYKRIRQSHPFFRK